jgi:hypothetical protein
MIIEILEIVIAAAITGPAGYLIKKRMTRNRYLPLLRTDPEAYSFINGEWFFYHFTSHDACTRDSFSSDAYTCIFPNLLNEVSSGVMIAREDGRRLYASAAVITKRSLPKDVAEALLRQSDVPLDGWLPKSLPTA